MVSWNRLPIAKKLPLALSSLLLLVMAGVTVGAFVVVRRVSLKAASDRLDGAARQIAEVLETSLKRPSSAQQIADLPATRAFLTDRSQRQRVLDTLRGTVKRATTASATPDPTIEVWSAKGERLLTAGSGKLAAPVNEVRQLTDALTPKSRMAIGPFKRDTKGVLTQSAAAIVDGGKVVGWVVDHRRVGGNPATQRLLNGLIGSEARLLLGNLRGDVWTDFAGAAEGPAEIDWSKGLVEYTTPGRPAVLARGVPLGGTPWAVAVEFPRALVMSTPNRFLIWMAGLAALFTALGALVGWMLSRPITSPLGRVTEAAEAIAAGTPSPRLEVDRADEVGRLASSFNTMAQRVEEARRDLERLVYRYRLLFEENPLPMWVYDREARTFVDVNEAAVRRYGFSREEFLSMAAGSIGNGGGGADAWQFDAAMPVGQHNGNRSHRHKLKNGAHIDVELTRHDVDLEGRPVALIAANDVTARLAAERAVREREEELRRLNAELEQRVHLRTAELEQANKELEAFSYSVSHDLRAPLRAIAGFSRIVLDEHKAQLSSEVRGSIEVVERNAKQMGQLLDDLLTFSRYSRRTLTRTEVDMSALAHSAADEARRGEASDREVDLIVQALPPAKGEHSMVTQVMVNLLTNAFKFTRSRKPARIEVGTLPATNPPVYFVRDNGVGFDMRYAGRLFGVFERLHRQEEYEGTGVGLAIVDRIVHRHGGRTWAEAEIEKGATIFFTLAPGEGGTA